jgi:hypothetical protein
MEADVTSLVSNNLDDMHTLQEMIMGTDVARTYEPVLDALGGKSFITAKYHLKPETRRKRINPSDTVPVLKAGGFMKGDGSANWLDLYTKEDMYVASVKTPRSVFKTELDLLFPGADLRSVIRTDRQVHDSSLGVYCYLSGSDFDKAVLAASGLTEAKRRLRRAMND